MRLLKQGPLLATLCLILEVPTAYGDSALERVAVGNSVSVSDQPLQNSVLTITGSDIQRFGVNSVADALSKLPQVMPSGVNPSTSIGRNGVSSSVSLRALSDEHTLVLLNGRRIAKYGLRGTSVDLSTFPASFIDRIEVIADPNSIMYGSDAIAGVINVILKTESPVTSNVHVASSYDAYGRSTGEFTLDRSGKVGEGRFFAALNAKVAQSLHSASLPFGSSAYLPDHNLDYRSFRSNPGNYTYDIQTPIGLTSSEIHPGNCSTTSSSSDLCKFDYLREMDAIPKMTSMSIMGNGTIPVTSSVSAYFDVLLNRVTAETTLTSTPVDASQIIGNKVPYVMPSTSRFNPFGSDIQVAYRLTDLGPRVDLFTTDTSHVAFGSRFTAMGWDFDTAVGTSTSRAENVLKAGYISENPLRLGLFNGVVNGLGTNDNGGLRYLHENEVTGHARTSTAQTNWLRFEGFSQIVLDDFKPVDVAFSFERREESISDAPSSTLSEGSLVGGSGSINAFTASRRITSFSFDSIFHTSGFFNVSPGVVINAYSDGPVILNPKLSLDYLPQGKAIRGHASISTGYLPPSLIQLNQRAESTTGSFISDPKRCIVTKTGFDNTGSVSDCTAQFNENLEGNSELSGQRSRQISIGANYAASKALTVDVYYWQINTESDITFATDSMAINNESNLHRKSVSTDDLANGLDYGKIETITLRPYNSGSSQVRGIDTSIRISPIKYYDQQFSAVISASILVQADQRNNECDCTIYGAGGQTLSYNGSIVPLPRTKARALFSANSFFARKSLQVNYISGYKDVANDSESHVSSNMTFDLDVSIHASKSMEIGFGIKNIFNKYPPFTKDTQNFAIGWQPMLVDPRGRSFFGSLTYAF